LGDREGSLVDRAGDVVGSHRGHHNYTVGQRRGIGVAGSEPLYVLDKDAASNRVVVGPRSQLRASRVAVRGARLHRPGHRVDRVKLRYRSVPARARVTGDPPAGRHAMLTVQLDEYVDAAAPGQLACLMDGELVVGWGTVARP
jgi:tRNA-specific 2-thiouridylase